MGILLLGSANGHPALRGSFAGAGVVIPPPAVPTNLVATAVSSSQIQLTWTAGVSTVNIYRATFTGFTAGPAYLLASEWAGTQPYQDTTCAASTQYFYLVRAVSGGNESSSSSEANATTQAAAAGSSHFTHARFACFDYRIHYLAEPYKSQEYDVNATRYDLVIGGTHLEYKSRDSDIITYVYDLIWALTGAAQSDMESWLTANGYTVEDAYLHTVGTSKTLANRISFTIWGSQRYAPYFGYAGVKAYFQARVASKTSSANTDSVFWDELGGSGIRSSSYVPDVTLEYASRTLYYTDVKTVLGLIADDATLGHTMVNTGTYRTTEDIAEMDAAGAVCYEFMNDVYNEGMFSCWGTVAARIAAGTVGVLVPQRQGYSKSTPRYDMNAGLYTSITERICIAEYANYLMLCDPANMDLLYVDFYLTGNTTLSTGHTITWSTAFETDIGLALGSRSLHSSGTDGAGQGYQVYKREFANAWVFWRPQIYWNSLVYGDSSAVTVSSLPAGSKFLSANGNVGSPIASIQLRQAEAAILMK